MHRTEGMLSEFNVQGRRGERAFPRRNTYDDLVDFDDCNKKFKVVMIAVLLNHILSP